MRIDLNKLKGLIRTKTVKDKKALIAVSAIVTVLAGAVFSYALLSWFKPEKPVIKSQPLPQEVQPVAPSMAVTQPQKDKPDAVIVEKNPFKAEFFERFTRSRGLHPQTHQERVTTDLVQKQIENLQSVHINPPVVVPVQAEQGKQSSKPDQPALKIYGVYALTTKSGDRSLVAITDKGEIREGMVIDGYRVSKITMSGEIQWEQK